MLLTRRGRVAPTVVVAPSSTTPPTSTPSAASSSTPAQAVTPAPVPTADGLPAVQYSPSNLPPPWPGPLPYPVLIADRGNNRMLLISPTHQILWQYPPKGGLPAGVQFGSDDDAFFTPGGHQIITNEEHQGTVTVVDMYTSLQTWTFGTYGQEGYGNHHMNYPDDAYRLPNGTTIVADIRNCRELFISPAEQIIKVWGLRQAGICVSHPAQNLLGSPNGDTPQPNGDILMSLIDGNRIVLMSPQEKVIWNVRAPDIYQGYVSDAQLLPDGNVLVADYNRPGKIIIFNPQTLKVVWLYDVISGPGELNHPSLAQQLPNGNIMLNDDYNDRVIVIDPQTDQIVWQYGHMGQPGTAAGFLNTPDGFDVDVFRNWLGWLQQQAPASNSSTAGAATVGASATLSG